MNKLLMESIADILIHLAPYRYKNLISEDCFYKLVRIYSLFPPWISHAIGFEAELGDDTSSVDTAFCIQQENIKGTFLPDRFIIRKPEFPVDPFWQSIEEFIALWRNPGRKLCRNIWLTFDLKHVNTGFFHPGIYIGIKEEGTLQNSIIKVIRTLFTHFGYPDQWKKFGETVSLCFNKLPLSAFVNYIGFMPDRSKDMVRVSVVITDPAFLREYFNALGIDDHMTKDFFRSVQGYLCYGEYYILHLDIGKKIMPRIGIEFRYMSRELRLFSQYRWNPFIHRLRQKKLCVPGKEKALARWAGMEKGTIKAGACQYTVFRFLYYIKLVFVPGMPLTAKAYFGYIFHPEKT
jgi:hypothetical protein